MTLDTLRPAVAEFIGAFTLTFIGAGAVVAARGIHDPSLIGVAIANGLAIGVMVSAFGHISGGHFNPAITFGFLITRRIKPALGVVYWVAQFGGAAFAALMIDVLIPKVSTEPVSLGVPALGNGVGAGSGCGARGLHDLLARHVVFAQRSGPARDIQVHRGSRDRSRRSRSTCSSAAPSRAPR